MKKQLVIVSMLCSVYSLNTKAQSQLTILPGAPGNARVGVNQFAPGNRLEINSFMGDPYFGTVYGSSGLRFTNLTNMNTPFSDSLNKVLSVDAIGNVILVTDNGGSLAGANNGTSIFGGNTVQLGGACGSASAASLLNNREIPMAGYNINFTMPANSPSQIYVGAPACTTASPARFTALSDNLINAGYFQNTTNSSSSTIGVGTDVTNNTSNATGFNANATTTSGTAKGLNVNAVSGSSGRATAVNAIATSAGTNNIALNGSCGNATVLSISANLDLLNSSSPINIGHQTDILGGTNASAFNYGAQLSIRNPGTNYGVSAEAYNGTTNYGIYATAYGGTTNYAAYFSGDLYVAGVPFTTNSSWTTSDKRFKKGITKLESVIDKVNKLSGYTYYLNTEDFKEKNFSKDQQVGLIAQEVKEVFPLLVKEDDKGYLAVNYQGMVPVLLEAIKEQQKQIDDLKKLVTTNIANPVNDQVSRMATTLSDKDVVILNQNQPNPFAEQTTISYTIPQNAGVAQLVFYDASGRQIKSLDITTKGAGQLSVYANDLTNGMYSYTLIIDGKIIDTKKMVKQQ